MTQLVSTYTGEYHLSIIGPDNKVKTAISKKNQLFPAFYKRYVFSENPNSYNRYYINTATLILESPENTALFESPDWYRKIYYDEDGIATKLIGVAGTNSEINVTANHLTNPGRLECSIGAAVDTETRIMGIILTSNVDGDIKERVFSCVKFDSVVVANASDLIKISYVVSATEFDEPTIATTTFNDLGAINLSISKLNNNLLKSFAIYRYGTYNSKFITNIGSKVFNNNNAYQVYFHTVYPVISTTPLPHTEINKCSEFNIVYSYGDISVTGFTSNFTLNFGPEDVGKVLSVVDLKLTIPFAPWTDADMRHIISGTGENNVKFDR